MYEFTRRCDGQLVKLVLGGRSRESGICSRLMLMLLRADHPPSTRLLPRYIETATLAVPYNTVCSVASWESEQGVTPATWLKLRAPGGPQSEAAQA